MNSSNYIYDPARNIKMSVMVVFNHFPISNSDSISLVSAVSYQPYQKYLNTACTMSYRFSWMRLFNPLLI